MSQFIDVVSELIYGTTLSPNHRAWEAANGVTPPGTAWIDHHVNGMLPHFETWISSTGQPPLVPWNGAGLLAWETAASLQAPPALGGLDGSFTGISTRAQLSQALNQRFRDIGYRRSFNLCELRDGVKAPFSHRYWSYVKWAQLLVRRFDGEVVVWPAPVYDRDGTVLSSYPFLAVFNELHWNFHDHGGHHGLNLSGITIAAATQNTPLLESTAGQTRTAINTAHAGEGAEFFRFHRDHVGIYEAWLARKGLPRAPSYNFTPGWPRASGSTFSSDRTSTTDPGAPGTWVEADSDPFINAPGGDTDLNLRAFTSLEAMGVSTVLVQTHADGHNNNADITTPFQNNYSARFFSWHAWLDAQWYLRAPRLGRWNAAGRHREPVFEPVLWPAGAAWPGLRAISIVRDPTATGDTISPAGAVDGIQLNTGAGTLKLRMLADDSYGRVLRLTLVAQVFNDATSATVPVETVTLPAMLLGTGQPTALNTPFTVDVPFAGAFQADSLAPGTPVGFVNSRIVVRATLEVNGNADPGFIYTDRIQILLVKEKQGPQIDLYLNQSTFGEDQVASAMTASGAVFADALMVTVQDRTSDGAPVAWPAEVHPAVRGLIKGFVPCSGLFDAPAHAPAVTFGVPGITAVLKPGSPFKENASLPEHLPQRFTYFYDLRFDPGFAGFGSIPMNGAQNVAVTVAARDRSANQSTRAGSIRLLRDANPYMVDGDPAWLSVDTRVFRVLEGESKFGATLANGSPDPNGFIDAVIANLRTGATGGDTFAGLPSTGDAAALVFFPTVTNVGTGSTRRVFNFALARVRLQGAAGASNVRAFFRLFRFTASNLVFNAGKGYRTHDAGGGVRVPLMGFDNPAPGGNVISIPFFAAPRRAYNQGMHGQTDTRNVEPFPPGGAGERFLYFGAYLDINQDTPNSRLPLTFISALAEQNGFAAGDVTAIRNIFYDAHVCMVVEIDHSGDPTTAGEDPFNSDNLAQRNLVVLKSDNPGGPVTHQVQHSFEVFTGNRLAQLLPRRQEPLTHNFPDRWEPEETRFDEVESDGFAPVFETRERLEHRIANAVTADTAFLRRTAAAGGEGRREPEEAVDEVVRREVEQRLVLAFDSAEWTSRGDFFDELMIRWNDLPREARATVLLPGVNCEHVVNLRSLRHAPGGVRLRDSETLELDVGGVTYLPIPAGQNARIPAVITIDLPETVRKGQRWTVDVVQLRGEEGRTTGAFQLEVLVSTADQIAGDERQLLALMFDRLSLLPRRHPWRPVLVERVRQLRERARALAQAAGTEWSDPTAWYDPSDKDRRDPRPVTGRKVRVVLEKVRVQDDLDPLIKGRGELSLSARVFSPDNGGQLRETRFPREGVFKVSDRAGKNELTLDAVVFEGFVSGELRVEVSGTERDTFDPDDVLGKYTRVFRGDPDEWYGAYGPGDERPIEPEDLLSWQVWYRVERP